MSPTYIWQREDWPAWRWDDSRLAPRLAELQAMRGVLEGVARSLDDEHLKQVVAELITQEAVSTSAIENVRLNPATIRSSVLRRLGLAMAGDRAQVAGPEARGLIEILIDSVANRGPLTEERLCGWHESLFPRGYSSSLPILVGAFRGSAEPMRVVSGAVGKETVHFEAPPADRLAGEMAKFLDWFNGDSRKHPAALRAAIAHLWFETLHPFEDGNGRIGRAVLDLAMAQDAALPDASTMRLWAVSRILESRRPAYYEQLENAQKGNLEITAWLEWTTQCIIDAQKQAESVAGKVTAITRFWLRHTAHALNERQKKVLKTILASDQPEPQWITTRSYSKIAGSPKITAARDIQQLVEWACIEPDPDAGGRSTRYRVRL